MKLHIFKKGNGQIIEGPLTVIRNQGHTRIRVGERDLDEIIATELIGNGDSIKQLDNFKLEWTVDDA